MKKYNISANLIQVIKNLYGKAISAVLFNSNIGDWFRTAFGVRQRCLLSPTLFNIFLERIMTDASEDNEGTVSTGGRTITNLQFADDIDDLAGEEEELANLFERLDTNFKYLGSVITDEGSKPEILCRIAQATAALIRFKPVWIDKSISLSSNVR